MVVVYCADRAIYNLLPTSINSLLSNNDVDKIYIVCEDDSISFINNPKIHIINVSDNDYIIKDGFNCTKQFPYMAMTRCALSRILSEDKVIYLDVDTIVDSSIFDLWNFNMGASPIAARVENEGYINSGVLLMNLKQIRAEGYDDRMLDLLKRCRFVFPDQDVINLVFKNRVAHLPDYFNKIGRDKEAYETGNFIIRHFAGITKPWKDKATKKDKELWNKYYVTSI